MKKLSILLLLFLLNSCSFKNDSKAIAENFASLKTSITKMNAEEIIGLMDQESKAYFEQLLALTDKPSDSDLTKLGEKYKAPLLTRLVHRLLTPKNDSLSEERSPHKIEWAVFLTNLLGAGVLNIGNIQKFSFVEVEKIDGSKATVLIAREANEKANIVSKYTWTKEGDDWKINIPSTFSLDEKILKKRWKLSGGGSVDKFLENYLSADKREEISFKYRK